MKRIVVDVPASDARRDRVEREVFARLDGAREAALVPAGEARRDRVEQHVFEQLEAIRGAERAERFAPTRRKAVWIPWLAAAGVAAAAILVAFSLRGDPAGPTVVPLGVTTTIVTQPGGSSRFLVGDAVVDAGSDTSVEVTSGDGVTLALARGSVDCDVEPRNGRPPFRVVAGNVTVEVVGTRFAVRRTGTTVRVDVTHGKVRVRSISGEYLVTNGQTWSSDATITAGAVIAAPAPAPEPAATPGTSATSATSAIATIDPLVEVEPPTTPQPTAKRPSTEDIKAEYAAAQRMIAKDPDAAVRSFRKLANGRGKYAQNALFYIADVESGRGHVAQALRTIDEVLRRFPQGAEDALWQRVVIYGAANQRPAKRKAAGEYLERFPAGTYAKIARSIVDAP